MKLLVRVNAGEMLPRGYGLTYRLFEMDASVCSPFPLNIVIRYLREFWILLLFRLPSWVEIHDAQVWQRAYSKGYEDARQRFQKPTDTEVEEFLNEARVILARGGST